MEFHSRVRSRARLAACVLSVALPLVVAAAELSPTDRAPPAVSDAVRDVWTRNPAVQSAEARLDEARARAAAAGRPLYNPDLDVTAENADVNTRSIGLSQTIDWSGKRKARETAATADVRAAEAERDDVRQRIAHEWLRGFVTFEVANEQTALGAERVNLLQSFADLAERRFRVGDIPVLERDLAVLATQEARAQQAELVAEAAKAEQLLIAVGSRRDALPPLPNALPPSADTVIAESALSSLPALRRADAETEAAQARITVAQRDRKPDPTVSLTGGQVTDGPFHDRLIGVSVKIPLFVRNSFSAEVNAAQSAADAADASRRDVLLRASAESRQTASSYNALRDAWLAWERSRAPSAKDRAALLQKLWEAGEISTSEYLVQLKQSLDTELTATGLRARVWQAFADWLAASSQLTPWLGVNDATDIPSKELPR
jgi:cobalt-zinc-cadmium efflux system outer membrane protein